jgi:hypothetical protein
MVPADDPQEISLTILCEYGREYRTPAYTKIQEHRVIGCKAQDIPDAGTCRGGQVQAGFFGFKLGSQALRQGEVGLAADIG